MIAPGSSTACVALGALTPSISIASSSCRREDKLSNDGLFVFLRRTEAELARLGASPFSLGASPCKACSPPFMVDFIVFSSLFPVLFVLPGGLAQLDVFPFSFRRLECSCHPSQSIKGDFSICWAPGRRLSSAFRSVLLFFSHFGVFADLLSGFSSRRVFSFFSDGLEFFSHPAQSKNLTSGAYRYQEGCSVSAQVGAFFDFLNGQRLDRCVKLLEIEKEIVREVARGDKPYMRKSTDRKAQIRKAFVQLSGLICALRSVDFLM